jgi:CheY-like chemotaxis protein
MEVQPTEFMEERGLVRQPSVLIVDSSEETREVLRTVLERRGLKIFAAARPDRGLQLAREHHPDLIVLDLEVGGHGGGEVCEPFAEESRASQTALVVLGTVRCDCPAPLQGEFVAKPYHYGPLIRRIEELLMGAGWGYARCA